MTLRRFPVGLFFSPFFFLCLSPSHLQAAEVYYLGQPATAETVQTVENRDLSLGKRLKDLVDFGSYGNYRNDRTGQISGSVLTEIDWQDISGNASKSFLERGTDYLGEVNINAWEQLWKDYRIESRSMVRKTDDRRIEHMRDLRLKDLNVRLYNYDNMLEFGDLYADFTNFTLGSSLEGFRGDFSPLKNAKAEPRLQFVAARKDREDVAAGLYQRNVFGGKIDMTFLKDVFWFSFFRIGSQAVTSQDDSSTAVRETSVGTRVKDLSDTVFGLDGDVDFKKYLNFRWEWARSVYDEDHDALSHRNQYGNALRLEPSFRSRYVSFRYLYYYVQPSFYTEVGSASTDKVQHQYTLDLTPLDKVRLSFVQNYYWDRIERSSRDYRTGNDEKYFTIYLRPSEQRRSFDIRTYFNYFTQKSDDWPLQSVESDTTTTGVSVNDRVLDTSVGMRYEYRAYRDDFDKSRSDYFNRLGCNLSRDFSVFSRRLFMSGDTSFDFRNPKSEDDNEITTGVSLNGQYDLLKRLALRGGLNVQNAAAAAPLASYVNTRTFLETDFLVGEKRASHFIVKIERNNYNHSDGTQDYKELRVITKFVSQF